MRILLDACVWGGAREPLRAAGHDVVWAGEWDEDPGDDEILARAYREARVLVTVDKDFGELAAVRRMPHAGIIRLVGHRAEQQAPRLLDALDRYGAELAPGGVVTVEPGRVRVRPPGDVSP